MCYAAGHAGPVSKTGLLSKTFAWGKLIAKF